MKKDVQRAVRFGFVMARPTQFEAPFFKFISATDEVQVKVLYLQRNAESKDYDPEILRTISWGFDLFEGYAYEHMPARGWFAWLLASINDNNFDMLIINGYYSFPLLLAALIAKIRGVSIALRLDTVEFEKRTGVGVMLTDFRRRVVYRLYDHFFAVSSLTAGLLERYGISKERISYFTYAVDVAHFASKAAVARKNREQLRTKWKIPCNSKVVIAVSKLSPRETPWDLLHAFKMLDLKDTVLFMIGDGPDRQAAESFVRESTLQDKVIFSGYVPYPELPEAYAVSDLFVHAAIDEPWGVSVVEAMACGLPVITSSRVGSGYDLVREGENGFLYAAGNAGDLAEKIRYVFERFEMTSVGKKNTEVLSRWDYHSTWKNIRSACSREIGYRNTFRT